MSVIEQTTMENWTDMKTRRHCCWIIQDFLNIFDGSADLLLRYNDAALELDGSKMVEDMVEWEFNTITPVSGIAACAQKERSDMISFRWSSNFASLAVGHWLCLCFSNHPRICSITFRISGLKYIRLCASTFFIMDVSPKEFSCWFRYKQRKVRSTQG